MLVKGWRRMVVALYGVSCWTAVELVKNDGVSLYGQITLTTIMLGYFGFDAYKQKKKAEK